MTFGAAGPTRSPDGASGGFRAPAPSAGAPENSGGGRAPASSLENPWPVRTVAMKVSGWIDRLGAVWVEGQLTQVSVRGNARTAFLVLRDPVADMSISVTCDRDLVRRSEVELREGLRVIVNGRIGYYPARGTLSLRAVDIRPVGLGALLARIERLRELLAAEGLFDPRLKRPLPFLPRTIGLITGREGAAEHDVVTIATERWPLVRFERRHTPVQGPTAADAIIDALEQLDEMAHVDVIVIARGGGSVEDLLPFSDEALCRAVVACTTPVVSAIGHEPDTPLLDYVADLRAATPTDAAKRVVPDARAELALVAELRERSASALRNWVVREERSLESLRRRPVLADPTSAIDRDLADVRQLIRLARNDVRRIVDRQETVVSHLSAQLSTLGPAATLRRGYAIVQRTDHHTSVVRSASDAPPGATIRVRVEDGAFTATVTAEQPTVDPPPAAAAPDPAPADGSAAADTPVRRTPRARTTRKGSA